MNEHLIVILGCAASVIVLGAAIKRTMVEIIDEPDIVESPQPSLGRCAGAEVSGRSQNRPDALSKDDPK